MEALGTFERQKARLLPAPAGTVFAIPDGRLPAPAAFVFAFPVFASSPIELSAGPNFRGVAGTQLGRQIWEGRGDRAGELGAQRGLSPFGLPDAFIAGLADFGGDGAFRGWAGRIWDGQSAFRDLGAATGPPQVLSGKSATPPALSPRWRQFWACPSATPPPTGPQRGLAAFGAFTGQGDTAPGPQQGVQVFGRPVIDASSRGSSVAAVLVGSVGDPTGEREKGRPAFLRDRGGGFGRRQGRGFGAAKGAPEGRRASLRPILADNVAALSTPKPAT